MRRPPRPPAQWITQTRKGLVELVVLNALARRPSHAYGLAGDLARIEGLALSEGTLYPLLARLKQDGLIRAELVQSPLGAPRKTYHLTADGKSRVELMNLHWRALAKGIDRLLPDP